MNETFQERKNASTLMQNKGVSFNDLVKSRGSLAIKIENGQNPPDFDQNAELAQELRM